MAERMLITKVVRTDATRADLYGRGHKWPDLKLFDLGELAAVGLEPAELPTGQEVPCRFWAIYELSDKINKAGNPYKDIVALEPMDKPATATSVDNSAILAELRTIRALLAAIVEGQGLHVPEPAPEAEVGETNLDVAFPRYGNGVAVGDNPVELAAYQEYTAAHSEAPASIDALRAWYAGRDGH
jgi:hypothetical protein